MIREGVQKTDFDSKEFKENNTWFSFIIVILYSYKNWWGYRIKDTNIDFLKGNSSM